MWLLILYFFCIAMVLCSLFLAGNALVAIVQFCFSLIRGKKAVQR